MLYVTPLLPPKLRMVQGISDALYLSKYPDRQSSKGLHPQAPCFYAVGIILFL